MKLEAGICGEQSVRVSAENTAKTMGSGTLDVFATPALVALAEKTCWQSIAPALEAGSGTHERFVIFEEKFAAKAEAKKG